jgi:metallophosphoesterase (TIGR00282 family)
VPLRVLFVGEVVGKSGIYCLKTLLPELQRERGIDITIAAAEGATGGFGIGKGHAAYLHKLGVDVITTGDFAYFKRDMVPFMRQCDYILRPANYPPSNPGRGWLVTASSPPLGVVSVLGQAGLSRVHLRNPFELLPRTVDQIKTKTPLVLVDFHATTTAEKATMFAYLDGRVSAVVGTHTRVLSADERILPRGTAVITHAGRTGSLNSVGGLDPAIETRKFLTQVLEHSREAWHTLELQGVVIDLDDTGRATAIERLRLPCPDPEPDSGQGATAAAPLPAS